MTRFISYITTSEVVPLDGNIIAQKLKQLYPNVPMAIKAVENSSGESNIITIDTVPYVIMFVPQPLPQDAYVSAINSNKVWPEARQSMSYQRAHFVVANMAGVDNYQLAIPTAVSISMITAAIVAIVPSIAVIWASGNNIIEANSFYNRALELAVPKLNFDDWVGLTFFDGPRLDDGARTTAVVTTGLVPFVGYELEWLPSALPPITIVQRVLGITKYLITNGPVLNDNDTLGISELERIRVRFGQEGQRPGINVAQLTLENLASSDAPRPTPPQPMPPTPSTPIFGKKR